MPLADANGGARPLDARPGSGSANQIVAGMKETHPEQYRGIVIPMYAVCSATSPSGTDTYRAPSTHDLVIEQIMAHVVPVAVASEPAPLIGNVTLGGFLDRLIYKAANALVTLRNIDREQRVIEYHSLALSALIPAAGGQPINFGSTPHKVPAGESLRLDVALANPTSGFPADTQYGLILVGKLVRVARS